MKVVELEQDINKINKCFSDVIKKVKFVSYGKRSMTAKVKTKFHKG